jgi:hypothetical protein
MTTIDPTVGRMILFHPPSNSTNSTFAPGATCAAIIAAVLPNERLNLAVFDSKGAVHSMESVPLIQEGDTAPVNGFFAEWMQYQKAVAKGETAPVLHATPIASAATPVPHATPAFVPPQKSAEVSPLSAASRPVGS